MILNYKKILTVSVLSIVLASCGNKNNENVDDSDINDDELLIAKLDSQKISAQNVFNALPNRKDVLDVITSSKAEYDPSYLNNPDNVKKYTTEQAEALNLGIYGADLNVTSVYEQTQESILFLNCVNMLAKDLGVSTAFDEKMMGRMDANRDNRDSTMSIVSQAFKKCDEFLVNNNRPGTSALVVAGSWIEGMHLACSTANATNSSDAVKLIFAQKNSLKYLIELLQESHINEKVAYLIPDLKAIEILVNTKNDDKYAIENIQELNKSIQKLREKIISSN